jgi:hypothetical protein
VYIAWGEHKVGGSGGTNVTGFYAYAQANSSGSLRTGVGGIYLVDQFADTTVSGLPILYPSGVTIEGLQYHTAPVFRQAIMDLTGGYNNVRARVPGYTDYSINITIGESTAYVLIEAG